MLEVEVHAFADGAASLAEITEPRIGGVDRQVPLVDSRLLIDPADPVLLTYIREQRGDLVGGIGLRERRLRRPRGDALDDRDGGRGSGRQVRAGVRATAHKRGV